MVNYLAHERAAGLALLPSRRVPEGIRQPGRRIGVGFGRRKSSKLAAGGIETRPVAGVADIGDPNRRRPQTLRALAIAEPRGADGCCSGTGHGRCG